MWVAATDADREKADPWSAGRPGERTGEAKIGSSAEVGSPSREGPAIDKSRINAHPLAGVERNRGRVDAAPHRRQVLHQQHLPSTLAAGPHAVGCQVSGRHTGETVPAQNVEGDPIHNEEFDSF